MLVTSIFSISNYIFHSIKDNSAIKPFPKQAFVITCQQYKSFKNTVRKGEIGRYEPISPFPSVFNLFGELAAISIKLGIVIWKLFQFERI